MSFCRANNGGIPSRLFHLVSEDVHSMDQNKENGREGKAMCF